MPDLYTAIEAAVLDRLQAWPGLSSVKTFERQMRDALYADQRGAKGFAPAECPAIAVSATEESIEAEPWSTGQMQYRVPVTVVVVTRNQTKEAARAEARELQREVERVVNAARVSRNAFDGMPVQGALTVSMNVISDAPGFVAMAGVRCEVTAVEDME